MNYYKRHLGDYAAATRHLSILEHGTYTLLLDVYYCNERPLPGSVDSVARLIGARSAAEKAAVKVVLAEFFTNDDGMWRQSRCDEEIAAKNERAEFNRTVGVKGGRPKKTQAVIEEKPSGLISETQTVSENNPSHKPLATSQDLRAAEAASADIVSDPRKQLWDLGVSILGAKSRSLIGAACKRVTEQRVAEVLAQMATSAKADPVAWFIAATTERERKAVF